MRKKTNIFAAVLAAISLVVAGSLTPAHAATSGITLVKTNASLEGSSVSGYDPSVTLRVTLISEQGKFHWNNNGSGVWFYDAQGDTSDVLTLQGTQDQLNAAFSEVSVIEPCNNVSYKVYGQVTEGTDLQDPISGHIFRLTSQSTDWQTAKTAAEDTPLQDGAFDTYGYLPTIGTKLENDIVASLNPGSAWLGANDVDALFQWKWITGPEAGNLFYQGDASGQAVSDAYTNWQPDQPDNAGSGESFVVQSNLGTWSDVDASQSNPVIVEFGGMPGDDLSANNFDINTDQLTVTVTDGFDQAGTQADPYQVGTAGQLASVTNCSGVGVYFKLVSDITLSDFAGIGTSAQPFVGHFDGDNHTITETGRAITSNNEGLFNYIGSNYLNADDTVVENITYNANITQSTWQLVMGGLAGQVTTAHINNISVSGTFVAQGQQIGAIAGSADETIFTNISSDMAFTVEATYNMASIGGLVGQINGGTVDHARFSGSLSLTNGGMYGNGIGGAFGYARSVDIQHTSSTGAITYVGQGFNIGGLIGLAEVSTIASSFASATVAADNANYVGGFIGMQDGGEVKNSYSTGSVSANNFVGGLYGGITNLNLHDVYSTASISAPGGAAGALVGDIGNSQVQNVYAIGSVDSSSSNGWYGQDETGNTAQAVYWVPSLVGWNASDAQVLDGDATMTESQGVSFDFYDSNGFYISTDGTAGYVWVSCPTANGGYPYLYATNPNVACVWALTNTPAPTITGTGTVGLQIDAVPGNWDSGVGLTYQWKLDGVDISGAIASGYVPLSSQVGNTLTVEVTGSKPNYPPVTKLSSNSVVVLADTTGGGGGGGGGSNTGSGDTSADPTVAAKNGTYVTTGDSAISWNRAKGLLGFKILVQYTGPIKATLTFKSGSKNYTCAVSFGILKKVAKFKQTWIKSPNFCSGKKEKTQAAALKKIAANTTVKIVTVRELHTPATYKKIKMKNRTIFVKLG